MRHTSEAGKDVVYIPIEGAMTIALAPELREAIFPVIAGNDEIEIDLSHVTEVDDAGVKLMVAVKLESILRDKTLRFVGHSWPVQEVLIKCDLGGFFGDPIVSYSKTQH